MMVTTAYIRILTTKKRTYLRHVSQRDDNLYLLGSDNNTMKKKKKKICKV